MCLLGKQGFVEVGRQCLAKAEFLKERIRALPGYSLVYLMTPTFHEFSVRVRGGSAAKLVQQLEPQGYLAGFDLGRVDPERAGELLMCVTERLPRAALEGFVQALDRV